MQDEFPFHDVIALDNKGITVKLAFQALFYFTYNFTQMSKYR